MDASIKQSTSRPVAPREPDRQFLTFRLAGELFGLDIANILEILEYQHLTEVPLMPAFIRGVMNLRGAVVPVVDLSARLGRGALPLGKRSSIVIVEAGTGDEEGGQPVGMLVDQVDAVLALPASAIEPAPQFGQRLRTDFIAGMAQIDGLFIVLLDIGHVLSIEEMTLLATLDYSPHESCNDKPDPGRPARDA